MEKSGKFQVNENKLITLGGTLQFPWKLPEISLWKVHNLPVVKTMENPVKKPVKLVNEPVKPVNTMENLSSLEPVKIGLLSNDLTIQEVFRQSLW